MLPVCNFCGKSILDTTHSALHCDSCYEELSGEVLPKLGPTRLSSGHRRKMYKGGYSENDVEDEKSREIHRFWEQ